MNPDSNQPAPPAPNQPWTPASGDAPPASPTPPSMQPPAAPDLSSAGPSSMPVAGSSISPAAPEAPSGMGQPVSGGPDMPGMMSANSMGQPKGGSNTALIIIAVVVIFLLLAGAITYFVFLKGGSKNAANNAAKNSTSNVDKSIKPLSTLNNMEFIAPTDLTSYDSDSGAAGFHTYLVSGGTSAKFCAVSFGKQSSTQLPGSDVNAIVDPQIAQLKKIGATVDGPTAGTARVLKDSANSSTSYSIPTLNFNISDGAKHETDHYSVSILGDGERALVVTSCVNATGAIDAAGLAQVDETAKTIAVKAE